MVELFRISKGKIFKLSVVLSDLDCSDCESAVTFSKSAPVSSSISVSKSVFGRSLKVEVL